MQQGGSAEVQHCEGLIPAKVKIRASADVDRISCAKVRCRRGCFMGGFGVVVSSNWALCSACCDDVGDSVLHLDDH